MPVVFIQEFVPCSDDEGGEELDGKSEGSDKVGGSLTGKHREVTHVTVNNF